MGLVERGSSAALALILAADGIVKSTTVWGELLDGVGAAHGAARDLRRRTSAIYDALSTATDLDHTSASLVAERYAEVSQHARSNGVRIGHNDRWIVAEAAVGCAGFVTADRIQAAVADAWYRHIGAAVAVNLVG